jgi:hypothetical protein
LRDYTRNASQGKAKEYKEDTNSEKSVTKYARNKAHRTTSTGWEAVPLVFDYNGGKNGSKIKEVPRYGIY